MITIIPNVRQTEKMTRLGMRNEEQVHTRDGAVILGAHRRTNGRRFLKSHFSAHLTRYANGAGSDSIG